MTVPVSAQTEASTSVNTEGRDLRSAAIGELALRFPARWLEEHSVLPLEITADGAVVVASAGEVDTSVSDALQRTLKARLQFVTVAGGEIRAALLATERSNGSSTNGDDSVTLEEADDLRAMASREPVVQVV
ncbi:MAG: hypothetical protein ABI852_04720, partial [Gemmatimonadaceae bacterium]